MAHQLTTHSSIWIVDLDAKMVTRVPRNEAPLHPSLPYEKLGAPRQFQTVKRLPHPAGDLYHFEDGDYWFQTGNVLDGELPLDDEGDDAAA